jgi:hypothetical protein
VAEGWSWRRCFFLSDTDVSRHREHIIRRASILYRHCCGALDYFFLQVNVSDYWKWNLDPD